MEENTAYERAKKRVDELKGFYGHVLAFITVNSGLAVLDALTGDDWWFYWVLIPWGIGMVIHAVTLFITEGRFGRQWEERKIREYMEHDRGPGTA